MTSLSVSEARAKLTKLVDEVDGRFGRIAITKSGKTKAVLMSSAEFEDWIETMEILAEKETMRGLRNAERERDKPRSWVSWDKVKRELDLQ